MFVYRVHVPDSFHISLNVPVALLRHIQMQMNCVGKSMAESHETLKEIKESHEKNSRMIEERSEGYQDIKNLKSLLAENAEVKLSSRVSEAEDVYVYSSPLEPLSPTNN